MKTYRGRSALAVSVLFAALLCLQSGVACAQAQAQHVPAVADGTPEIDRQIAATQLDPALHALDQRIASNPSDVQAKFKRATVLARLDRDTEAIAAFTALTQQYPELPEPYNNLAALYAKRGDLNQARANLETAVAANPAYALANQNLGTLYLRLALQTYQRATKVDPRDALSAQRIVALDSMLHLAAPMAIPAAASAASAPTAYKAPASINSNPLTQSLMNPNQGR